MFLIILGLPVAIVGAMMMANGWTYFLKPDGPKALKRKARNMEVGFPTDMKVYGRKLRRLGTIIFIVGSVLISAKWW